MCRRLSQALFAPPLCIPGPCSPSPLGQLQSRQREYKVAALHAKQQGDLAAAARYFRVAKVRVNWTLSQRGCQGSTGKGPPTCPEPTQQSQT